MLCGSSHRLTCTLACNINHMLWEYTRYTNPLNLLLIPPIFIHFNYLLHLLHPLYLLFLLHTITIFKSFFFFIYFKFYSSFFKSSTFIHSLSQSPHKSSSIPFYLSLLLSRECASFALLNDIHRVSGGGFVVVVQVNRVWYDLPGAGGCGVSVCCCCDESIVQVSKTNGGFWV